MDDPTKRESAADSPGNAAGRRARADVLALLLCLLFFLQGLAFVRRVPIHNDEALFAAGIFQPITAEHTVRLFRRTIPTMVMSYIGAPKTLLYAGIFRVWPPSLCSLRLPVLAIGALTVWLFFLLLRDTIGRRAALAACALLATDATFVLTTTLDWGPAALQHLLVLSGLLLLWKFYRSERLLHLGAGFFAFGLGLWDKSLFVWMLVGLAAATAVVFPRELLSKVTFRHLAVAGLAFAIGASPLIQYNAARRLKTLGANVRFSTAGVGEKAKVLRYSLQGDSMFGYVAANEPPPRPGRAGGALEQAALALSNATGRRQSGFLMWAALAALALLPWLWNSPAGKPMLFALVFMVVTWLQMALNQDTGGGAHHVVLMWPFPHLFIAVAFTQASLRLRRAGLAVLVAFVSVICASNVLVTNQYLAQLTEWGTTALWTDAVHPLSGYMERLGAKKVYVMDWGMFESLRFLNRGRLPLLMERPPEADPALRKVLSTEGAVFLGHTTGNETAVSMSAEMQARAEAAGYRKEVLTVIADRNARPMFEVYRYRPATAAPPTPATSRTPAK